MNLPILASGLIVTLLGLGGTVVSLLGMSALNREHDWGLSRDAKLCLAAALLGWCIFAIGTLTIATAVTG